MNRSARRLLLLLCTATVLLGAASPALASHQQGGFFTAQITAAGRLQGTLVYLEAGSCAVGQAAANSFTLKSPSNQSVGISTSGTWTRCLSSSRTSRTTFDVDLAATFGGSAPAGTYTLEFSGCCRVSGIQNMSNTSTLFRARVTKVSGQATGAPNLSSDVALGIAKGYDYAQNLNASDPDGGALSYATTAGESDGPNYDIVTYGNAGQVSIPASTTQTLNHGARYVYKVRVTDDEGDYSERDVLLTVTGQNAPPEIQGLDSANAYTVQAGAERVISFTASDPNATSPKVDTVSISAAGLPAWATLTSSPGNPAQGSLHLTPPADAASQTVTVNVDAVDNDSQAALTASTTIQLTVVGDTAAPAAPVFDQAPAAVSSGTSFAFSGEQGASLSCSVDDAAWTACESPLTLSGLADGSHTLRVRARDVAGNESEVASHTWTLDSTPPSPPVALGGPVGGGNPSNATFELAGEPGATFECRVDGGEWTPCASPFVLTGLADGEHRLEVRQIDLAGHVSDALALNWGVGGRAPAARPTRVTPVLASRIAVNGRQASVGCMITSGSLRTCEVRAYVRVQPRRTRARSARSRLVYVGRGRVSFSRPGTRRARVHVRLTTRGRRLVERLEGARAVFRMSATARDGVTLRASRAAQLLPERLVVVPVGGLFASDSATLSPRARAYLRATARRLSSAHSIRCTGHTDDTGAAAYNDQLGLRRAEAVCAALRRYGVRARMEPSSRGESAPRASNATSRGRALNRRVELTVAYRA